MIHTAYFTVCSGIYISGVSYVNGVTAVCVYQRETAVSYIAYHSIKCSYDLTSLVEGNNFTTQMTITIECVNGLHI